MKKLILILIGALALTSTTFAQKWVKLFDGKTLTNWHVYNKAGQPISDKWSVKDGVINYAGKAAQTGCSPDTKIFTPIAKLQLTLYTVSY